MAIKKAINAAEGYIKFSPNNGVTWFKDCFAKSDNIDKSKSLIDVTGLCASDMTYISSRYTDNSVSMDGFMLKESSTLLFLEQAFDEGLAVPMRQGNEEGEGALYQQGELLIESFNVSREVDGAVQVSISGKFQNITKGYL